MGILLLETLDAVHVILEGEGGLVVFLPVGVVVDVVQFVLLLLLDPLLLSVAQGVQIGVHDPPPGEVAQLGALQTLHHLHLYLGLLALFLHFMGYLESYLFDALAADAVLAGEDGLTLPWLLTLLADQGGEAIHLIYVIYNIYLNMSEYEDSFDYEGDGSFEESMSQMASSQ